MEIILKGSVITEWNIIQLRKMRLQSLSAAQANFITLGLQARRKLQKFNWIQLLSKTQKQAKFNSRLFIHICLIELLMKKERNGNQNSRLSLPLGVVEWDGIDYYNSLGQGQRVRIFSSAGHSLNYIYLTLLL